ncbi:unnamed protein product [Scytosiphon promiscuus]
MTSGGFTENDQARIAEDVLGRVGAKRSGLGFNADVQPAASKTSASSSAWFDQHAECKTDENVAIGIRDTTEGPFAWGAGQREKTVGAGWKTAPSRANDDPLPERAFPMVRDRDIEAARRNRQPSSRRRSGSRSRSRSRSRRRRYKSRSRSRSNERKRRRAERTGERQRAREKELQRGRARERERERGRERSRRSHNSRSRDGTDQQRSKGIGKSSSVPTADQTRAALKRQLRKATVKDTTLKTGAKSTVGGGAGWERPEMSTASDFFTRDEISSKGGVASVAPEFEARLAEILRVEDEDTLSLQKGTPPTVAGAGNIGLPEFDPITQRHHDAIFAPMQSVSEADTPVPRSVSACAPVSRVTGVVGAAARARSMLSGELQEDSTPGSGPALAVADAKTTCTKSVRHVQPRESGSEQPLFKTLRVGEVVEAQYTADDRWYKANILQTIHSGFEIARYKVKYDEYGNEETVGWTRIRRLDPAAAESCPAPVNQNVPDVAEPEAETSLRADDTLPPFAGMRPRQTRVDVIQGNPLANSGANDRKVLPEVGDVVNPTLRSATAGQKMSWKDRVAAKKAGAKEAAAASVRPKKQISLVRDFETQSKERADTAMDTSQWRAKVVFGIGGSRK